MDRPAYRLRRRDATTVFADTGEVLEEQSTWRSRGPIASRFVNLPEDRDRTTSRRSTKADQWTLGPGRQMPLHKFRVDDAAGTELYVSPRTGEVTLLTTRRSRTLAWIGTIPHWLYFAALRDNQPLWYRIVVWTSAPGCACCRARPGSRRRRSSGGAGRSVVATAIPYSGWMRWHYITGVVFGVFTLTWAFSGLLSMEPFAWTNAHRARSPRATSSPAAPSDLVEVPAMDPAAWDRLLDGRGDQGSRVRPHPGRALLRRPPGARPGRGRQAARAAAPAVLHHRTRRSAIACWSPRDSLDVRREPFSADSLIARLAGCGARRADRRASSCSTEYDSYYYSRRRQTPLPVLRVKFDDPGETWVYIDPEMSQVLAQIHRLDRVERWLYNGLHSLDFSFWYNSRPLWDIGMIVLLLGGLASSWFGLLIGVKRLRRAASRTTRVWQTAPPATEHPVPHA